MPQHDPNTQHHERPRTSWATRIKLTAKIIAAIAGLIASFYAGGEVDDVFDDRDDCVETEIGD